MPTAEDVQARIAAVEAETGVTIPDVEPEGVGPTPVVSDPVTPAPSATPDPYDDPKLTSFDRPYVERLRAEAAEARTKAAAYKDLDGIDETRREAWLNMARTYEKDPQQVIAWMKEIVDSVPAATPTQAAAAVTEAGGTPTPVGTPGDYVTRADLTAMLGAQEAARMEAQLIQETYAELAKVGLNAESADPAEEALALAVMKVAAYTTGGDIPSAYKLVVLDPRQKAIDDFVAGKAKTATIPGASATPGGIASIEKTRPAGVSPLEWAKQNALARLKGASA